MNNLLISTLQRNGFNSHVESLRCRLGRSDVACLDLVWKAASFTGTGAMC